MALSAVAVPVIENALPITVTDFGQLFCNASLKNPGSDFTAPFQAADFYTGLCALQPKWRNLYLANHGHAGCDSIHIHGEYGYAMLISNGMENAATLFLSESWVIQEGDVLGAKAVRLLYTCMRLQVPVDLLIQWFDTMTRKQCGKRTSPYFDPIKSLNKIGHRAEPMFALLDNVNKKFPDAFGTMSERGL